MNRSSKGAATGVKKPGLSKLVKDPKEPLPNTKGKKAVPPTRKDLSAVMIQRAWLSYMDKTIFQLLKHTICAAEYCVTHEILKNVCPLEAELVNDPGMKCKVRFRFSGETFPPFIVFKIFLHTGGRGCKYISGKNVLKSSSKASKDAYKIMGKKKFHEQIMEDEYLSQKFKVTDEVDIVTMQDYRKVVAMPGIGVRESNPQIDLMEEREMYSSLLDKTPASSGGRSNYWRRLNLKSIPRTMIMYDIVDYSESGVISTRLQKEMKYLLQRPRTEAMRQHQLRIVSEVRQSSQPSSQRLYRPAQHQSQIKHLGRRSKQAQMKNEKMRKAYEMEKGKKAGTSVETEEPQTDRPDTKHREKVVFSSSTFDILKMKEAKAGDKLEKNKNEPFAWCRQLYIHRPPPF